MRNILYIAAVVMLLASCGSKGDDLEAIQERAGTVAQEYYKHLVDGKYEDFVAGMDGADSLPAAYREQMIANTAMFVKQQTDEHKGIKDVAYTSCIADTAAHTASAMLSLEYADGVHEVVCVPLVERGGNWYMK